MANTIEYAKLYQKNLDQLSVQDSVTGWMEANAGQVIYNGGREIKIPKMSIDGLADYDRAKGYAEGAVTLEYETRTMTQDRGKKFVLDAQDVDESGFVATGAAVLGTFQSEKVVPEIDAYRLSTLYGIAKAAGNVSYAYNPSAAGVLAALKADIANVRKKGGKNLVVHISYDAMNALEIALAAQLHNMTWAQGGINTQVPMIDNCPLIATEDARLYTKLTISKDNGYTGTGAINWIVADARAPIAVSKTDVPRIFAPDVNQNADAWIITYRKYHDLWVADNKKALIAANVQDAEA